MENFSNVGHLNEISPRLTFCNNVFAVFYDILIESDLFSLLAAIPLKNTNNLTFSAINVSYISFTAGYGMLGPIPVLFKGKKSAQLVGHLYVCC